MDECAEGDPRCDFCVEEEEPMDLEEEDECECECELFLA